MQYDTKNVTTEKSQNDSILYTIILCIENIIGPTIQTGTRCPCCGYDKQPLIIKTMTVKISTNKRVFIQLVFKCWKGIIKYHRPARTNS